MINRTPLIGLYWTLLITLYPAFACAGAIESEEFRYDRQLPVYRGRVINIGSSTDEPLQYWFVNERPASIHSLTSSIFDYFGGVPGHICFKGDSKDALDEVANLFEEIKNSPDFIFIYVRNPLSEDDPKLYAFTLNVCPPPGEAIYGSLSRTLL